jgi:hypothetical protein
MTYRSDLDALEARHASLETEAAHHVAERDDARRLLEDARQRARLPVLDNIRIAAPCTAAWDNMAGDDTVRHCGDCKKNVFDLSEMTREQAEATIIEHDGKLCVRYYRRADGKILTKDCAVGTKMRRRRRWFAVGAAAALAGAVIGWKVRPRAIPQAGVQLDVHTLTAERVQQLGGDGSVSHEQVPVAPEQKTMGVVAMPKDWKK